MALPNEGKSMKREQPWIIRPCLAIFLLVAAACDQQTSQDTGSDGNTILDEGMTSLEAGDTATAIEKLNQSIESGDLDQESLISAYFNRGVAYGEAGDMDKAIADYTRALELDNSRGYIFVRRGNAYLDKGDLQNALLDFNRALDLDPEDTYSLYWRAQIYVEMGDVDAALAD